ncbi:40S ribosomal protein S25 [Polytolypa hystricis UAMH7299]|uniref:40S ribosomal protein S25 n=1 Tax=Polytolypa hystricis (strain UAMH7299) TaxID=1447883 RepID=A0A2B7YYS9_POLH7|nr:40S ribosomal protein S25 [Polytolypa hystricis UAMH7299]
MVSIHPPPTTSRNMLLETFVVMRRIPVIWLREDEEELAPAASAGGKKQKKKWSKGKVKDKANHSVLLDKTTSEKLYKDVQSYRLITVATLVDRLKINGSLARKALSELEEKGQIKKVVGHSKMVIYSTCFPARGVYGS